MRFIKIQLDEQIKCKHHLILLYWKEDYSIKSYKIITNLLIQFIKKSYLQLNFKLMGQTCETCQTTNMEFVPLPIIQNQQLQNKIQNLRVQLMKDQPQQKTYLKNYQIAPNIVFTGKINQSGKRQGYGEIKTNDRFFAGIFVNDLPQGTGILIDRQYLYEGEFRNGKPHGKGQQSNKQMKFVGDFQNGQKSKGKLQHTNYIYEGQFKNNLFNGKGKINYILQRISYQGSFKNGKFHGEGLLSYKDKYKYEGNFQEGNYHGKGLMLSQCGQIFQGQFQDGFKNGEGWMKTNQGYQVFGKWQKSQLEGNSLIKFQGHKIRAEWNHNKLVSDAST